jgi:opacity protein-like surface antigen
VSYRGYVNADIRGRAGYAFGNFLPFVAAGYSFGRGEIIDNATGSEKGRVPLDAFTAGGGLDYRVSQRVSFRIEDLYDFASTRKNIDLNGCTTCSVTRDGNTVRAGFAYHFE